MAALFLIWSVIFFLLTLNVYWPLRLKTQGIPTFSAFFLGWIVGDLGLHWIIFSVGITLAISLTGALGTTAGILGLMLHITSWIALAWRFKAIFQLRPLVQKQMQSALGKNYEAEIEPELRKNLTPLPFDWKAYWNPPSLLKDDRVEVLANIPFFEEHDVQLYLDIYRPRDPVQNGPALMEIHGGVWTIGTKNQKIPLFMRMAAQGWVCFAITYRLSPRAVFPDHLVDCKRALHWIKTHGSNYGADPNFIIVTGGSAGGHLGSLTTLTENQSEFQPGFEEADTSVAGCVSFYGLYDFETPFGTERPYPAFADVLQTVMQSTPSTNPHLYRQASPIQWVAGNTKPMMLVQGLNDALVDIEEAHRFYQALHQEQTPRLVMLTLPMVQHAFDLLPTVPTQCVLPAVERYLTLLRTDYLRQQVSES